MLHILKLRLSGFKSFAEPMEFGIGPGLTGVVGPNGCGKSNLVEALRWVMAEASARSLRGDEMDDVVFAGSATRPARPFAEVVVELDNAARTAPAPYADAETIEVSRRLDRGRGSLYRINGREVRARDVNLLFVDQASGARSAAMVTQGQVGSLIAAKPAERRAILEEAAGIGGLQPRRQEAQSRLKTAEDNLARLEDVFATLAAQEQGLAKQVRQAQRYRKLAAAIRKTEATLFGLRWRQAVAAAEAAAAAVRSAETEVAAAAARAAASATEQGEAAAALPGLRRADGEAGQELHRLDALHTALEADERRFEAERKTVAERCDQAAADLARARQLSADAGQALERLAAEQRRLSAASADEPERLTRATADLAEVDARIATIEGNLLALTEQTAAGEARRVALERAIAELSRQRQRLDAKEADLARRRRQAEEALAQGDADAEAPAAAAAAALSAARTRIDAAEAAREELVAATGRATAAVNDAAQRLARLDAEYQALAPLVATTGGDDAPLADTLTIAPGYEQALVAALGEDLLAPLATSAPVHWRVLAPLVDPPPLPAASVPLASVCAGNGALDRRLSQIGIVDDPAAADALHAELRPGQQLVSADGAVWRWDGLVHAAGQPPAVLVRLEQRRRLEELAPLRNSAAATVTAARAELEGLRQRRDAADAELRAARTAVRQCEAAHEQAQGALATLRTRTAELQSRGHHLAEAASETANERAEIERRFEQAEAERAALADLSVERARLAEHKTGLAALRARQLDCRSRLDAVQREAAGRRRRLDAITAEIHDWQARAAAAAGQLAAIEARQTSLAAERAEIERRPAELQARRQSLLDAITAARRQRSAAADALALAESRLAAADRALRQAELALAEAREARIRAEGQALQAVHARQGLQAQIFERLGNGPDALAEEADPAAGPDDIAALAGKLERLQRERDAIGPVNLRAEDEARALAEQIAALQEQSADLLAAIAKLRRGVTEIDREARERLLAAFAEVDQHFRTLFVRIFGGGRAELRLDTPEDPLASGLEILASPPGKKLHSLSLLSGGEQALTALALRFAVFLTRPTPICVLDEVDAPLDDVNVDRFCTLLAELAGRNTRFVVITHHRLTMARMDRLFGVTMAERGVSQLVSVDLRRAEAQAGFVAAPAQPAVFAARSGD